MNTQLTKTSAFTTKTQSAYLFLTILTHLEQLLFLCASKGCHSQAKIHVELNYTRQTNYR